MHAFLQASLQGTELGAALQKRKIQKNTRGTDTTQKTTHLANACVPASVLLFDSPFTQEVALFASPFLRRAFVEFERGSTCFSLD